MDNPRAYANERSHASAFLRHGAVIFGLGTATYHILQFISFFQEKTESPCYDIMKALVPVLGVVFTILQVGSIAASLPLCYLSNK